MHSGFLFLAAFLASSVEMVEALTIVLAAGVTRGWRSALTGAGAAVATLAAVVAVFGPALRLVPIDALRLLVGGLLLVFGLQWLGKAILRASHLEALHDEEAVYALEVEHASTAPRDERIGLDWYAFTLSFKGVLLEGLEVAFIVLAFGSTQGRVGLAALAALTAVVLVTIVGVVVHGPLSRVPENTLKLSVGVLLTTFGCLSCWSQSCWRRSCPCRSSGAATPPSSRPPDERARRASDPPVPRLLVRLRRRRRLAGRGRRGCRAGDDGCAGASRGRRVVAGSRRRPRLARRRPPAGQSGCGQPVAGAC